jgi:SAM-dependent methyltransferase
MFGDGVALLRAALKEVKWFLRASPAEKRHFKAGPLHLWQMKRDFQIRFLKEAGLQPAHRLLDIGCGTLRGGIPIIAYLQPGHYYGIEARRGVWEEALKELDEAGLQGKEPVLLNSGDLAALKIGATFEFVWAFSVLIHMSDETAADCIGLAAHHLKESGLFYANASIGPRHDNLIGWQGFPVVTRSWEFYQELGQRHGLRISDLGTLASLRHISGIPAVDTQHMLRFAPTPSRSKMMPHSASEGDTRGVATIAGGRRFHGPEDL